MQYLDKLSEGDGSFQTYRSFDKAVEPSILTGDKKMRKRERGPNPPKTRADLVKKPAPRTKKARNKNVPIQRQGKKIILGDKEHIHNRAKEMH